MNMPRRPRFAACLLTAALVTACTMGGAPSQPPDSSPPGSAILAFQQADRMRFADATGRVWGEIEVSQTPFPAVWSADGKHFAWLDDSRLHIVEAATGTDRSQPCPCSGLDRLGDVFATLSANGSALLLFDPVAGPTTVPLDRPMPSASVEAGGRDHVAAAEPIPEDKAAYRGQSALTAIDREGNTRLMIEGDSAVSIAGGFTSPDGTRIATIESPSSGACSTTPGVFSLRNSDLNPRTEPLIPSDTPFTEAVLGDVRDITSANWAGDAIVVTFGPNSNCQSLHAARYVTYFLRDTEWRFLRNGVLGAGFGAEGRSYSIELPESISSSKETFIRGKLVLTTGNGIRKDLAESVSAFWSTPAEQAAGRPPASPPVDSRITTTDHGKPFPQAFQNLADQLAKALDSNDTATLATLCANCDDDTRTLLQSQAGRSQLRLALRTHPAGDDRSVTFPGLVVNQCVDGRVVESACTMEQLRDVGTLNLPSSTELVLDGLKFSAPVEGSIRFVLDETGAARWVGQSISAQNYRHKATYEGAEEFYFFKSPDDLYICGFDLNMALCQGKTEPVPPRPASCAEGPSWGGGMFVDATQKVDFVCAGGVLFYPIGREPENRDKLTPGQTIAALGFTCSAEKSGVRCTHDATGHGFLIAPHTNERF